MEQCTSSPCFFVPCSFLLMSSRFSIGLETQKDLGNHLPKGAAEDLDLTVPQLQNML